jgi:hypothetical protein
MFRKLLAAIGLGAATAPGAGAAPPYSPYSNEAIDSIYNLLFCDDISSFKPKTDKGLASWQAALFSEPADIAALVPLSADSSQEGRVRYLAYWRLRGAGQTVPAKVLLGVIVEMPLSGGLDAIAAYSEGGVRYINQTGKLAVFEVVPRMQPFVQNLMKVSQPIVDRIGPWEHSRLPPPKRGNVRLTFLVSDGLFFGEGPVAQMQGDPMAGQVIRKATELLQEVVALSTTSKPR